MWNDKKPWWQKPKGDPRKAVDREYAKNWCVVAMVRMEHTPNSFSPVVVSFYRACAMLNAPKYFTEDGKVESSAVMSNLTKQDAHACAKGLNFFDGQT